jgi:hypothetical protein
MKRFVAAHLGLMIVLVGSTAFAQAPPINENLKCLKPLIGKWVTEITLEEDSPGVGKKGEKISYVGIYKWTPNRNAMTLTVTANVGDQVVNVTNGLLVWDAANKKILGLDAYVQGGIFQYEVHVHDDETLLVGHGANGEGAKTEMTVKYTDLSKDSFTGQFIKRKEGGKELPDLKPYTLTRMKKKS